MKQTIISLLFALLPLASSADAVEIDSIYYNLVSKVKTAEVTSNPKKYTGAVDIPENVTYNDVTYSVTKIGNNAFSDCSNLTSVTIPNSVTSIGRSTFYNCSSLTSVIMSNSVTSIGERAFGSCSGLTSITIPNSVISIGSHAFSGCYSLANVTLSSSLTSIEYNMFYACESLTSVDVPNSVTSIGDYAFYGCNSLTRITIGNFVTTIGSHAFYDCAALEKVVIPNSVTKLGINSFDGCISLTDVYLSNSLTEIGIYTFNGCISLKNIILSNSTTTIGGCAFRGCNSLTTVTIGNSVNRIGGKYYGESFANCPNILDVYCYAENVPNTNADTFNDSYVEYITLHVPAKSVNDYKSTSPWSGFRQIVPIEDVALEKCATPSITYTDNEFTFSCETEGVEYVWQMTVADGGQGSSPKVGVTGKYKVSVYATKDGYENSDTATMEVDIRGKKGDVSGDGEVDATDITKLIDIILQKNTTINTEQ